MIGGFDRLQNALTPNKQPIASWVLESWCSQHKTQCSLLRSTLLFHTRINHAHHVIANIVDAIVQFRIVLPVLSHKTWTRFTR